MGDVMLQVWRVKARWCPRNTWHPTVMVTGIHGKGLPFMTHDTKDVQRVSRLILRVAGVMATCELFVLLGLMVHEKLVIMVHQVPWHSQREQLPFGQCGHSW